MWTRRELKKRAKENLSGKYWKIFFVTMISGFIIGYSIPRIMIMANINFNDIISTMLLKNADESVSSDDIVNSIYGDEKEGVEKDSDAYYDSSSSNIEEYISNPMLVMYLITFLLVVPITVGVYRFIMNAKRNEHRLEDVFFGFSRYYKNIVVTYFLKMVYIFLWTLVFVIPGIIKQYQYYMVEFILADNPEIGIEEAFELSKRMTEGNKWKIFFLEMSFFWWFLLGFCCFFVGVFFVIPYYEATKVELYLKLKEEIHQESEELA